MGIWYALAAFVLYGLFPLYFTHLEMVPPMQMVAHRVVWSCLLLTGVFAIGWRWRELKERLCHWRVLAFHVLSACFIGANWLLFVWAVNNGQVLGSSLGYYLNPLLSIVVGVLFFKERLRNTQKVALVLAVVGILTMAIAQRIMPWLPLAIATSFGGYGLMKKLTPVPSAYGLWLETVLLGVPATLALVWWSHGDMSVWNSLNGWQQFYLSLAGVVTVVPTLLFALATTRIPLSTLGFLQFLTPTISFLLGVFLYNEPFLPPVRIAFVCIWCALVLTSLPERRKPAEVHPEAL